MDVLSGINYIGIVNTISIKLVWRKVQCKLFLKPIDWKNELQIRLNVIRVYGSLVSNGIYLRLSELQVANNLSEISNFPPSRLHLLVGNFRGCYAVNVTKNVRMIFKGLNQGGVATLVKANVVKILIKEISDYHDK